MTGDVMNMIEFQYGIIATIVYLGLSYWIILIFGIGDARPLSNCRLWVGAISAVIAGHGLPVVGIRMYYSLTINKIHV